MYQLRIVNRKSFVRRSRPLPPPPTLPLPILPTLGRMEGGGRLGWRRQTTETDKQDRGIQTEPKNKIDRDGWIQRFPAQSWPAAETPKTITLGLLSWTERPWQTVSFASASPKSCSSRPYRVNTVARPGNKINPEWVFAQLLLGATLNKHWRVRLGRCPREPVSHPRSHWAVPSQLRQTVGRFGGVVNSLDFCPASLKSLGCFTSGAYFFSQSKAVTVNLRNLHCQL